MDATAAAAAQEGPGPPPPLPHGSAEFVQRVLRRFLSEGAWGGFPWGYAAATAPEVQRAIATEVLAHPLAVKFPPSVISQRRFLKRYVTMCEEAGEEVAEELYLTYATLATRPSKCATDGYQTFLCRPDVALTVPVSRNLVAGGTTGLALWPAALAMVEWILAGNAGLFAGKRVLELGSGCGLLGLALARLTTAELVLLTDHHPAVLGRLRSTLALNGIVAGVPPPAGPTVDIRSLDWEDFDGHQRSGITAT